DQIKREMSERGRNARQVTRFLDSLRDGKRLSEGVPMAGGGTLQIHLGVETPADFPFVENGDTADMRILALADSLAKARSEVIFITKDANLRIKADAIGINSVDYVERGSRTSLDALDHLELETPQEAIDQLFQHKKLPLDRLVADDPGPNALLLLRDQANPQHTALARRQPDEDAISLADLPRKVSGISPKNLEQRFALDLLLDSRVPLVNLVGKAGTGKTLLALAAGLMLTVDAKRYRRLLVARPIYPMGRDIGFLPGELEEKLRPWMQPIFDNLELLLMDRSESRQAHDLHPVRYLIDAGLLEIEALTYIRGRSLPNQFMIVDEAQNLTPHEVKTVITRAGTETKVVLTGDPDQIDNPYVDAMSNGLSYTAHRLRGHPLSGTVVLRRGERSALAELGADRL
ncbi:MAG: PhoH family protein, partial [Acidobacteriota bacterium]